MSMSPQQMQAVQDWIKAKLGGVCPICKSQAFSYQDKAAVPSITAGGQTYGTPMGMIPISCADCGHTVLVDESNFRSQE
jgi:predicted Zn-ribbon and HTH transcriptional regulator